jgi:4-coumarate--CoA ligase (photoactive yellow protein activation family)
MLEPSFSFDDRCPDWWAHEPTLRRYLSDLLAAELAQARPGRALRAAPWPPALDFVRDLGADSLELLGMAASLDQALHLGGSGSDAGSGAGPDQGLLARPCLADWLDAARAGLAAGARQLSFRTSGSAGSPKRCTHPLAALWQETRELARLLPGCRRILSAVPAHHIYGFLFTVLLPRLLGIDEVVDLRSSSPAFALGQARAGDLVVAHPGWWEALLRLEPAFGAGVAGVSSGAPCPDLVADGLAAGGLRLLQVYGSSETGGVGWRDRAGAAFALLPHWQRVDGSDELARRMPDGGVQRYPLQDKLDWRDARHFLPAGRIDQAVQVGGVNVFPAYVAEVLRMHPGVQDAAVRLMRADEGRRLKAFIVPRAPIDDIGRIDDIGEAALREELAAWIAARLPAPECPAAFTFGARLPRQASGKPADWIVDAG